MSDVTYHFNSRSTGNWTDPDYWIDNVLTNYATTAADGTTETLDGNTCPGTNLGIITKVELRVYGYGDGNDRIDLTPVFAAGDGDEHELTMPVAPGWSSYVDITNDTNAPGWSGWSDIQGVDVKCEYDKVGAGHLVYGAKVEIRVTYTLRWEPPVSDIDVGAEPIDRLTARLGGYTTVNKDNPANASGTLHSVKVWAASNISGLIVGTFYLIGENILKCRDSAYIGTVIYFAERTFSGLSIAVEAGDYIGGYWPSGTIERDSSGFAGFWYKLGEYIDPGDEVTYGFLVGHAISLYGYGDIPPVAVGRSQGYIIG